MSERYQRPPGRAAPAAGRDPAQRQRVWRDWSLLGGIGAIALAGAGLWLVGQRGAADLLWIVATCGGLVPGVVWVARSLRRRQVGVDVIAVLALVGALVVREYLAGAVVAVMLATGRSLEAYAERRAAHDLHALLAHAPRSARRRTAQGTVEVIGLADVRPADRLLVGPSEVVAVDGCAEDPATLDESAVTGESRPVDRGPGDRVVSGVVNAGPAFGMRATTTAEQSTFAGIVRLAKEATERRAPMVRLADRYAAWFVPFTLLLAGASWLLVGNLVRAVAVLVVATPCPLILATPIAIVSGLSRAARCGVVVRDGGSLEILGRARCLLVDKTGTLTLGQPRAGETVSAPGVERDEVLRLAASVEQLSGHVMAAAVVREARSRSLALSMPTDVTEEPGKGASGRVEGRLVRVGQFTGAPTAWTERERQRAELDGTSMVWVSVDGQPVGAILVQDPVRPDARLTVRRLREAGFTRLVMVTGDRPRVANDVARSVGVDDVVAQCSPEEKVERVRAESAQAITVMVGDGVNDAPALAAAGVGLAMGATGATASAEVADAVLTVDRLDRLADVVEIARHARRIAVQSATVGMGLAVAAMGVAAAGYLPPVAGAFLQEGIDVVVILNALRALTGGARRPPLPSGGERLLDEFAAAQDRLRDVQARLRATADLIATRGDLPEGVSALRDTCALLDQQVLPHEEDVRQRLYPCLTGALGVEAGALASRVQPEIRRLVDRVRGHLDQVSDSRLRPDQVPDLLATLYGLDAVLRLQFTEERENLFSLSTPSSPGHAGPG